MRSLPLCVMPECTGRDKEPRQALRPPCQNPHTHTIPQTTPLYEELEKQFYEELEGRVEKKVEEALSRKSRRAWAWGVVNSSPN